jgi:prevent-host-death family protein
MKRTTLMATVNMFDAKTNLSRLVEAVETGREKEIIIARNGRPVARLVSLVAASPGQRVGIAKGKFVMPDSIDGDNTAIEDMFRGEKP